MSKIETMILISVWTEYTSGLRASREVVKRSSKTNYIHLALQSSCGQRVPINPFSTLLGSTSEKCSQTMYNITDSASQYEANRCPSGRIFRDLCNKQATNHGHQRIQQREASVNKPPLPQAVSTENRTSSWSTQTRRKTDAIREFVVIAQQDATQ